MKRRVVITGMGAVTPIGNTIEEFGMESGQENQESLPSHILMHQNIK